VLWFFILSLSRPVERSSFERQGSEIATWMLRSCDGLKGLGHEVSECYTYFLSLSRPVKWSSFERQGSVIAR
jgi:hypothetical protein